MLGSQFGLVRSKKIEKQDFAKFWQKMAKLPIEATVSTKDGYLFLLSASVSLAQFKNDSWLTIIPFANFNDYGIKENHILQLLINRLMNEKGDQYCGLTPYTLVTHSKWNSGKNGRYALKISVEGDQNLSLKVASFHLSDVQKDGISYYYYNRELGQMVRSLNNQETDLYVWRNGTKRNNSVNYLDFNNIDKFELSKVGYVHNVLQRLQTEYAKFFKKSPVLAERKLLDYKQPKVKNKGVLWSKLDNENLYIYSDAYLDSKKLADELATELQRNADIMKYHIHVHRTDGSHEGLNIQVVNDLRDKTDDQYEVSRGNVIIQHVTTENFGMNLAKDRTLTTKLNKLSQELVIRRDITQRKISTIQPENIHILNGYEFFLPHKMTDSKIQFERLQIDEASHLKFDTDIVNPDIIRTNNAFDEVYQQVISRDFSLQAGWGWRNVYGIIKKQNQYVIVMQTEQITMPDEDWLEQELTLNNPAIRTNRVKLLNFLNTQLNDIDTYTEASIKNIQQLIAVTSSMSTINVSPNEIRAKGKDMKTPISLKGKGMRELHQRILQNSELSAHFMNDVSIKENRNKMQGLYGIGLMATQWVNTLNYFVGSSQSLKKLMPRAYRVKKVELINMTEE